MLKISVCEDNNEDFERLRTYLKDYFLKNNIEYELTSFNNAESFISQYDYNTNIIFMDIMLGDVNGLEASKKIRELDSLVTIIFVTNMSNLAIEGYKVNASDFIVKPIDKWNLELVLNRVLPNILNSMTQKIIINYGGEKVCLTIDDILYIEVSNHNLTYHTKNKSYTTNGSLSDALAKLSSFGFALSDKSYLVNLKYVSKVGKDLVTLKYDKLVPISRRKKQSFLIELANNLGGSR